MCPCEQVRGGADTSRAAAATAAADDGDDDARRRRRWRRIVDVELPEQRHVIVVPWHAAHEETTRNRSVSRDEDTTSC